MVSCQRHLFIRHSTHDSAYILRLDAIRLATPLLHAHPSRSRCFAPTRRWKTTICLAQTTPVYILRKHLVCEQYSARCDLSIRNGPLDNVLRPRLDRDDGLRSCLSKMQRLKSPMEMGINTLSTPVRDSSQTFVQAVHFYMRDYKPSDFELCIRLCSFSFRSDSELFVLHNLGSPWSSLPSSLPLRLLGSSSLLHQLFRQMDHLVFGG